MHLQQVRYFLALCEEKSFTRAASRCGVTQPSLTNGIKRLETELGASLFCRHRRRTELSDAGGAVLPIFMSMERSAAEARRAIEDIKMTTSLSRRPPIRGKHQPVRIAFAVSDGSEAMPQSLPRRKRNAAV